MTESPSGVAVGTPRSSRAPGWIGRLASGPWHPVAFAFGWVLNAYVATSPSPFAVIRTAAVVSAAALLALVLGRVLVRGWHAGALLATAIVAVLTIGREVVNVAMSVVALGWWRVLLVAFVVTAVVAAAGFVLRRHYRGGHVAARIGRDLNVLAALVIVFTLPNAIGRGTLSLDDLRQGVPPAAVGDRSGVPRTGPDIYVVLLDGYPRGDTLRDHYAFDNSAFLDALTERGFDLSSASHSNYLYTQLTLSSFFHMSLLPDVERLATVLSSEGPTQPTVRRTLNDNPVFEFLRGRGYLTVSYAIPYEDPVLRQADVLVQLGGLNEFERQLIGTSIVLDGWTAFDPDLMARSLRSQIREAFAQLAQIAANRRLGPRFVFAHVMAPHTPFVFGPTGEPIRSGVPPRHLDRVGPNSLSRERFSELLVGQVQYVNREALAAVDEILASSTTPPIILVLSDHGPRANALVPELASDENLREAFGTLFAAHTPGKSGVFPQDVTPSQVMAHLLNAYFDAAIPIAGSETFASDGSEPFHLIPVREPPSPPPG